MKLSSFLIVAASVAYPSSVHGQQTASPNLEFVGNGFCLDSHYNPFSYIEQPGISDVNNCNAFCSQLENHDNLRGFAYSESNGRCYCHYEEGQLPDTPAGAGAVLFSGSGGIILSQGYSDRHCYRYLESSNSNTFFYNWSGKEGPLYVCLVDDGTHTVPKGEPRYNTIEKCCDSWLDYEWDYDYCISNSPPNKYFPNWDGHDAVCLVVGNNIVPEGAPLYDDLASCCDSEYPWNLALCNASEGTNKYFPDWDGYDFICLKDDGNNIVPEGAPLYDDLASCCDTEYPWNSALCNVAGGPSNRYYPDWENGENTCLVDNGRRALPFGVPLYDDLSSCCEDQYRWAIDECNNSFIP